MRPRFGPDDVAGDDHSASPSPPAAVTEHARPSWAAPARTMPSTPQTHPARMAPAASFSQPPAQSQSQSQPQSQSQSQSQAPAAAPNGLVPYPSSGYNTSFDGSQPPSMSQPLSTEYRHSFNNGPVSTAGFSRSFGEVTYVGPSLYGAKPQIYTAVYSGVTVYEMEVHGVTCMRRRSDGWLNATQILKVAGIDKGKRTKVLEKEILTGEHEKVQGGYGKYQGTWVSYRRGRQFCRQYGVEEMFQPLLDYDITADGTSHGQDTPTKEQAMAANRKRFYNTHPDSRPSGASGAAGTFFSNISPTTSVALAAMNKAASLNSPAPRPVTQPRPTNLHRPSHPHDAYPSAARPSTGPDMDPKPDSGYSTQATAEPRRKRMRLDSQDGMAPPALPYDGSMRSATPTEPNESFFYDTSLMQDSVNSAGEPLALPPLPSPNTDEQQDKMNLILDLFAEQARTDYSSHAALTQLSGDDLNMPLDASANSALHWAATLAKVPLLKLLIRRGASIWRGNAAGQSPLISAVLVNNCWEQSCFPEVLEVLNPLIEVRDLAGRTVLHHIAVSSGIKGRAPSSKYYLEALLEFLVRIGTHANSSASGPGKLAVAAAANAQLASRHTNGDVASQDPPGGNPGQQKNPVNLVRFLSHVVNARDKAGNTALNLVARIGNRSIIQQLLEIHADPSLPNNKGISAKDFGVSSEVRDTPVLNGSRSDPHPARPAAAADTDMSDAPLTNGDINAAPSASQTEDLGQEIIASLTSMLTQNLASHKEQLQTKTLEIDRLNEQIREFSALQKTETTQLQELKDRIQLRAERQAKIANLRRELDRKRRDPKLAALASRPSRSDLLNPTWLRDSAAYHLVPRPTSSSSLLSSSSPASPPLPTASSHPDIDPNPAQRHFLATAVPAVPVLAARRAAVHANNHHLRRHAAQLRSRSTELEALYRRVVSLCTGVTDDNVEDSLPGLVAAIESERGGLGEREVGRVREFLRRVDGVVSSGGPHPHARAVGGPPGPPVKIHLPSFLVPPPPPNLYPHHHPAHGFGHAHHQALAVNPTIAAAAAATRMVEG